MLMSYSIELLVVVEIVCVYDDSIFVLAYSMPPSICAEREVLDDSYSS
jgi:hypothetical protein